MNIAHLRDIDCSAADWDRLSDDRQGGDWDPPFDEVRFAQMDLRSPSEPAVGHRELRASDRGEVPCLTA